MAMIDEMLDKAFAKLDKKSTPILHSDQGWQYRHRWYQYQLKASGVVQSMSRRGNCLDNACAECFFGTLKSECFYLNKFNNIEELKTALSDYIHYYNNQRISIKLKGLSPVEYRLSGLNEPTLVGGSLSCCMLSLMPIDLKLPVKHRTRLLCPCIIATLSCICRSISGT